LVWIKEALRISILIFDRCFECTAFHKERLPEAAQSRTHVLSRTQNLIGKQVPLVMTWQDPICSAYTHQHLHTPMPPTSFLSFQCSKLNNFIINKNQINYFFMMKVKNQIRNS
jgi:hypothetical protein